MDEYFYKNFIKNEIVNLQILLNRLVDGSDYCISIDLPLSNTLYQIEYLPFTIILFFDNSCFIELRIDINSVLRLDSKLFLSMYNPSKHLNSEELCLEINAWVIDNMSRLVNFKKNKS